MKNNTTLKNNIGLTQEESAIYFGVTIGHWSMITIGKRDLPLEGTIKLADLLQHLKKKKSFSEARQQLDKVELEKVQVKLQQDYKNIKLKLHQVDRKISKIENIRKECFAALEVADFIDSQKEKQPIEAFAKNIRLRALKTLKLHDLYALEELQLKRESLEILKITLEKKINKYQK